MNLRHLGFKPLSSPSRSQASDSEPCSSTSGSQAADLEPRPSPNGSQAADFKPFSISSSQANDFEPLSSPSGSQEAPRQHEAAAFKPFWSSVRSKAADFESLFEPQSLPCS